LARAIIQQQELWRQEQSKAIVRKAMRGFERDFANNPTSVTILFLRQSQQAPFYRIA
jgi:hypothetical protein